MPSDVGQMQLHALPVVRRGVQSGKPIWYLQTESSPPEAFWKELDEMRLCARTVLLVAEARLVRWEGCN